MRFISFITRAQPSLIGKILDHVGEPSGPSARGPPKWHQILLAQQHVEANAHVYGYDDADGHGEYDPDAAWSQGNCEQN